MNPISLGKLPATLLFIDIIISNILYDLVWIGQKQNSFLWELFKCRESFLPCSSTIALFWQRFIAVEIKIKTASTATAVSHRLVFTSKVIFPFIYKTFVPRTQNRSISILVLVWSQVRTTHFSAVMWKDKTTRTEHLPKDFATMRTIISHL